MHTLSFIQMPGGWEWLIILGIALLIFGRRLPEVGRSIGKTIVEFRKGMKGIEEDIEAESNKPAASTTPKSLPTDAVKSAEAERIARGDAVTR